jgi:hypothetical protein
MITTRGRFRPFMALAALAIASTFAASAQESPKESAVPPRLANPSKIEIRPIDPGPTTKPVLTLRDDSRTVLVNMIPRESSAETSQNSDSILAVHDDGQLLAGGAFTDERPDNTGHRPLLISTDGGLTWAWRALLPFARMSKQTLSFSGSGRTLYAAMMHLDNVILHRRIEVAVLVTEDPTATETDGRSKRMQVISPLASGEFVDLPFIHARNLFGSDRIYVGQNYFGPELGQQTASVRVSADGGKTFRLLGVEARTTASQDAPPVKPAVAKDGTVYVAFIRWATERSQRGQRFEFTGDVVIVRDDDGAVGESAFRSLDDPSDRKPGHRIVRDRTFDVSVDASLGQERTGRALSVAVDPNRSATVYVAWGDRDPAAPSSTQTLHVRRSIDRGVTWTNDLISVPDATNPALAVAENGTVGFLYQQLVAKGTANQAWETHFRAVSRQPDDDPGVTRQANWSDLVLAAMPTSLEPKATHQPFLGDSIHLMAVGDVFYGAFSAPNIPDPKFFPEGVLFQRTHRAGQLVSLDGKRVATSIDPYFARIRVSPRDPSTGTVTTKPVSDPINLPVPEPPDFVQSTAISWAAIALVVALVGTIPFLRKWLQPNVEKLTEKLTEMVTQIVTAKVGAPALINYTGFVSGRFADAQSRPLSELGTGQTAQLEVSFGTDPLYEAARIDLRGGQVEAEVVFTVVVDSDDVRVEPERKTLLVSTSGAPASVSFNVTGWPSAAGSHTVFVQVFQKAQLVQVLPLSVKVG